MKSYRVELVIDEDVLKKLEQAVAMKRLVEAFYGLCDEFLFLVVKGWREKSPRLHIETKKKGSGKKRGRTKREE